MFLLYFILVSRWQVFYHLSMYHLGCLLSSEQEWVSIQENLFQNPVKCIKSISILSTLFVLSTFITIMAIKLNSAIWDKFLLQFSTFIVPDVLKQREGEVRWGYRNQAQRDELFPGTDSRPMAEPAWRCLILYTRRE